MTDYKIWKPEHDGHAPPNWREGMKWGLLPDGSDLDNRYHPAWCDRHVYYVEPEALNSPNDDASGDIPAFPTHGQAEGDDPRNQILTGGMTLRDYFAAAALTGVMQDYIGDQFFSQRVASAAYRLADAMIAERSKRDA